MNICIRLATIEDLDNLTRLEAAAFNPSFYHLMTKHQFKHLLAKGNSRILIAEIGKKICGAAILLFRKNSSSGRLYSLSVHPEHQREGIGARLIKATEKTVLGNSCKIMLLEIREDNLWLYEYYKKLGYEKTHIVENYYPDGTACIKMKKTLKL